MAAVEQGNQSSPQEAFRISDLRRVTIGIREKTACLIHRLARDVTPYHVTTAGIVGVAIGSWLAVEHNSGRKVNRSKIVTLMPAIILTASSLLDGIDGTLAKVFEAEDPSYVIKNPDGDLDDTLADRQQEATLAVARILIADSNDRSIAQIMAALAGLSNAGPSLMRAIAQGKGRSVNEDGIGVFGKLGTRPGRAVLGILATTFPEVKGFPLGVVLDVVSIGANVATTYERVSEIRNGEKVLSDKKQKEGWKRATALGVMTAVTAGSLLMTYRLFRKSEVG